MNCNIAWNRTFLNSVMTLTFMKTDYRTCRENLLMDREKSLLPATQPYAEYKKMHAEYSKTIRDTWTKYYEVYRAMFAHQRQLAITIDNLRNGTDDIDLDEERSKIFRMNEEVFEYKSKLNSIKNDIGFMTKQRQLYCPDFLNRVGFKPKRVVMACPAAECRGFIGTTWKCGLCSAHVCSECHEIKAETDAYANAEDETPHVCNPATLESVQLMGKDSRQCPKCPAIIFKINGCDQIFCTQCNTAFSWASGEIDNGRIHNPHYFEYVRRKNNGELPRNPFDGCMFVEGNEDTLENVDLRNLINLIVPGEEGKELILKAQSMLRFYNMIKNNIRPKYTVDNVKTNRNLRIAYLLGEIGDNQFKQRLRIQETKNERNTDIYHVLSTMMIVVRDYINAFMHIKTMDEITTMFSDFEQLFEYINKSLLRIAKREYIQVPYFYNREKGFFECINTYYRGQPID